MAKPVAPTVFWRCAFLAYAAGYNSVSLLPRLRVGLGFYVSLLNASRARRVCTSSLRARWIQVLIVPNGTSSN